MAKYVHGHYYLENKYGYFLFNSYLRRGRAFLINGKVIDIMVNTHPKLIVEILTKGSKIVGPFEFKIGTKIKSKKVKK